mmetsp:Transcript_25913/g.73224  ORF Transcript_25913/g.73224 Transcript_25913/m.73224 type:complete len:222 (+) Transcript_25913:458-1123(+)
MSASARRSATFSPAKLSPRTWRRSPTVMKPEPSESNFLKAARSRSSCSAIRVLTIAARKSEYWISSSLLLSSALKMRRVSSSVTWNLSSRTLFSSLSVIVPRLSTSMAMKYFRTWARSSFESDHAIMDRQHLRNLAAWPNCRSASTTRPSTSCLSALCRLTTQSCSSAPCAVSRLAGSTCSRHWVNCLPGAETLLHRWGFIAYLPSRMHLIWCCSEPVKGM